MSTAHLSQLMAGLLGSLLTMLATVGIAAYQVGASRRASRLARLVDLSGELGKAVGDLRADILPFWKDRKTRERYGNVSEVVQVHRSMERIRVLTPQVEATVLSSPKKERRQSTDIRLASRAVNGATMVLYLALVPDDPFKDSSECRKEFMDYQMEDEAEKDFVQRWQLLPDPKNDPAQWADQLVENCWRCHEEALIRAKVHGGGRGRGLAPLPGPPSESPEMAAPR